MQTKVVRNLLLAVGAIAIGGLSQIKQLPPAISQGVCPDVDDLSAVQATRTVTFAQFGLRLEIPQNYRTMLRNDGSISILKPGDFNLIRCLAQGVPVMGTDAVYPQTLRRQPNPNNLSLAEFAQRRSVGPNVSVSQASINGIEVTFAEVQSQFDAAYAWYQAPDVDGIIEIQSVNKASLVSLFEQANLLEMPMGVGGADPEIVSNPTMVALAATSDSSFPVVSSFRETIERENDFVENPQRSTVIITQEGFLDDSVYGKRTTVLLDKEADGSWVVRDQQVTWRCQRGPNTETYTPQLCP